MSLFFRCFGMFLILMCHVQVGSAGEAHINQMEMKKISATSLSMDFSVNPAQFCHALMAPEKTFMHFLKSYSEMSPLEFKKEWDKSIKKFESNNFILLPSGVKVQLKQWTYPKEDVLQELLKKAVLILDLPPSFRSHLEPVSLSAIVQSKTLLNRIQLHLSPAFHPVLVQYKQDRVWFTEQIPAELFDL